MPSSWIPVDTGRKTVREKRDLRFARQYHSKERTDWVSEQRCCTCGAPPPSQNSHIVHGKRAGESWLYIGPQCVECHLDYHRLGRETFERTYGCNLEALAEETQRRWLEYSLGRFVV